MFLIRPESPSDIDVIETINREAFGGSSEADLVAALRRANAVTLSLVAELEGEVVGHILFSPGTVVEGERSEPIVGLAPMAVLSKHQRAGIGSALVVEGLRQLRMAGHNAVAVLGHPDFYPRFGFTPSVAYSITCEYNVEPQYFMVAELEQGALAGVTGTMRYHPLFADL